MSARAHYFDNPRNVKRVLWIFCLLSAGLFLLDLVVHRHVTHGWESRSRLLCLLRFCRLCSVGCSRQATANARDEG